MYAVNLRLIARGNWRNVGVIDYQIGIKREKKKDKIKKCRHQLNHEIIHPCMAVGPLQPLQFLDDIAAAPNFSLMVCNDCMVLNGKDSGVSTFHRTYCMF